MKTVKHIVRYTEIFITILLCLPFKSFAIYEQFSQFSLYLYRIQGIIKVKRKLFRYVVAKVMGFLLQFFLLLLYQTSVCEFFKVFSNSTRNGKSNEIVNCVFSCYCHEFYGEFKWLLHLSIDWSSQKRTESFDSVNLI